MNNLPKKIQQQQSLKLLKDCKSLIIRLSKISDDKDLIVNYKKLFQSLEEIIVTEVLTSNNSEVQRIGIKFCNAISKTLTYDCLEEIKKINK
jgi:hypothetical protein